MKCFKIYKKFLQIGTIKGINEFENAMSTNFFDKYKSDFIKTLSLI